MANSSASLSRDRRQWFRWCLALGALAGLASEAAAHADETDDQLETARVHWQKGRVDEALEVYEGLAGKKAVAAQVAVGRSRCFESRGEWKSATEVLESATKDAAGDARLLARLAEVYLAQGRSKDAARTVAQALKIDANLPLARLVEADLNAAVGNLKQADEGYHWFVKFYNQNQPEDAETLLLVAQGASQYARWHSVPQI